jgi:hypothetical protein
MIDPDKLELKIQQAYAIRSKEAADPGGNGCRRGWWWVQLTASEPTRLREVAGDSPPAVRRIPEIGRRPCPHVRRTDVKCRNEVPRPARKCAFRGRPHALPGMQPTSAAAAGSRQNHGNAFELKGISITWTGQTAGASPDESCKRPSHHMRLVPIDDTTEDAGSWSNDVECSGASVLFFHNTLFGAVPVSGDTDLTAPPGDSHR